LNGAELSEICQFGTRIQAPTKCRKGVHAGHGKKKKRTGPYGREEKERRKVGASGWLGIGHANGPRELGCGRTRWISIV